MVYYDAREVARDVLCSYYSLSTSQLTDSHSELLAMQASSDLG